MPVTSGQWSRRKRDGGVRKAQKQSQIARDVNHWHIVTYDEPRRNRARKQTQFSVGGRRGRMRLLGDHKEGQEEQEESENCLCIRFPLHPTLSHLLNLVYLLVDGLFPVPSISPSIEEWLIVSEAEGSAMAVCEKAQNEAKLLVKLRRSRPYRSVCSGSAIPGLRFSP